VEGWAHVENPHGDTSNDFIPIDAFKAAWDGFSKNGAILMHQHTNRPIGKVLSHSWRKNNGEDALFIKALIYRANNEDIIEGLHQRKFGGFSIGAIAIDNSISINRDQYGKEIRTIGKLRLHEISLVDMPACTQCTITAVK
jgi:HK97 family phage prohead protease